MTAAYTRAVGWVVHHASVGFAVYGTLLVLTAIALARTPTGFIPAQDMGYLIVSIQLPDGASLERTDAVVRQASKIVLDTPGMSYAVAFAGFSGATRAN